MNRLKELRKQKGLTLVELGKEVNLANNTLNQYERGIREPSISMLIKLANYFNVTVDYLIGREEKNKIIKSYRFYIFDDDDYVLRDLGEDSPISEYSVPILDESEFEFLKYSIGINGRLSTCLGALCNCYYENKISDGSFEDLARILVNKEAFHVEVIERVDS